MDKVFHRNKRMLHLNSIQKYLKKGRLPKLKKLQHNNSSNVLK